MDMFGTLAYERSPRPLTIAIWRTG